VPTEAESRWRLLAAAGIPLLIFAAATGLRAASSPRLDYDEHIFLDVGANIVATGLPLRTYRTAGPQLFFDHTPLYVYAVAFVSAVGGPTSDLVRALSALAGFATVALVFAIGRSARGLVAGFIGATLVAVNAFFITYSWFVRMEVPLSFFLVLATWLLLRTRPVLAGLSIALAVLLKEIALAFWLVAAIYQLRRTGWRDALRVAAPAAVAFLAWLAYAAWLDAGALGGALRRWLGSAAGGDTDPRLRVSATAWTRTILVRIVGWRDGLALAVAVVIAVIRRSAIPAIAAVPIGYVVIAVASSYVIRLKEPRYLIAIVPMTALIVALIVDWDELVADIVGRIRGRAADAGTEAEQADRATSA
jgi:hypothetical protein